MLKITAIGNLTNDVELKTHDDGRPCALRRTGSIGRRTAPASRTSSPSRSGAVWRNAAPRLPTRAASWPRPAISRPSLPVPTASRVSSSRPTTWKFSSPKRPKTPPLPPKQTRKMPTAKCLKAPRLPDEKHRHRVQQHRPNANRAAGTCRTAPSSDGGAAWRFGGGPDEKRLLRAHHCQRRTGNH